jgi:transposase
MARIVLILNLRGEDYVDDTQVPQQPVKGEEYRTAEPPPEAIRAASVRESPSPDIITSRNRGVMLRWLEGQSPDEIAQRLNIDRRTVDKVLRLKAVKREIRRLSQLTSEEYLKDRVSRMAEEALDTLRDTMRGANASELRFKAAKELLDKVPALRPAPPGSIGHDIGVGLGESIISRLAQMEADAAAHRKTIDVTPKEELND